MVLGAILVSSFASSATCSFKASAGTASLIKPHFSAWTVLMALPRITKSRAARLGMMRNKPPITMKGQMPRLISGAENFTPSAAIACVILQRNNSAPANRLPWTQAIEGLLRWRKRRAMSSLPPRTGTVDLSSLPWPLICARSPPAQNTSPLALSTTTRTLRSCLA